MTGDIHDVTHLSSVSLHNTLTVGAASLGTAAGLSLGTWSLSIATASAATKIPSGYFGIVQRASGLSLVYVSGATVYNIAGSATSGAA
jgi:hypothetical protein